jgi:hypothetical protein
VASSVERLDASDRVGDFSTPRDGRAVVETLTGPSFGPETIRIHIA